MKPDKHEHRDMPSYGRHCELGPQVDGSHGVGGSCCAKKPKYDFRQRQKGKAVVLADDRTVVTCNNETNTYAVRLYI